MTAEQTVAVDLPAPALRSVLGKVCFLAKTGNDKEWLNAAYLHRSGTDLEAVASDGCAIFAARHPYQGPDFGGLTLPSALAHVLLEKLGTTQASDRVTISQDEEAVVASIGKDWRRSALRLLEDRKGEEMVAVIPKTNFCEAAVPRGALLLTLEQLKVDARVEFDMDSLMIGGIVLQADVAGDEPVSPLLYDRFRLHDIVSRFDAPRVTLGFRRSTDPVVISARGEIAALAAMWFKD